MSESPPTQLTADQQIERDFRFNFLVNMLDGAAYWFGFSFIAPTIILPLYISHFTSNPLLIGLIPVIGTAGFLLPQMFTANIIERAPRKKFFPVNVGFFTERLPVLLLAPTAYFFAKDYPQLALISFLAAYTWYGFGAGLIIVGWQDMIAKIIPVDKRGRFFGISNFIGMAAGVLGALAVPIVLDRYDFPTGFVIAFAAGSVLIFLSWVFLSLTREPPVYSSKPRVSQAAYLRSLPSIVRKDANFRNYLISQIIISFSAMAAGFLVVFSAEKWNLSDSQASGYIIAMQIGQALANPVIGFLADRRGHKLSMEISVFIGALSFGLAYFAPSPAWFYPIFFLRGATMAGMMISGISIVMEFTRPEDRPTYIGLANTIPGLANIVAPLAAGWLAVAAGYQPTFLLSAVFGLLGLVLLRSTVREPRNHKPEGVESAATAGVAR